MSKRKKTVVRVTYKHDCFMCGQKYETSRSDCLYCGPACRQAALRMVRKYRIDAQRRKIKSHASKK